MRDKTFSELHDERKNDLRFSNLNVSELFELNVLNATEIKPLEQPWLWQGYIPLETCTLMAGKGGIGKSQFLMWLAAIISNGHSFSTGDQAHEIMQGNVIILSAEDHPAYTIIPRLMAAGADLSNIHIIESAIDKATKSKERFI
jgi:RecA-family ATPase